MPCGKRVMSAALLLALAQFNSSRAEDAAVTAKASPDKPAVPKDLPTTRHGGDLPTSKTIVSGREMENNNAGDGTEAVKDVAGVTSANAKTAENSSINVRGIQLNLYTSYRLNGGLPTAGIITTPLDDKARFETLKGANALMFGIASPGGIVNMVTKRAGEVPVQNLTVSGSSFGAYGGELDLGRRFGPDGEFGVRVNGSMNHVEPGFIGASGKSHFGSGAFDWRALDRLVFKLDLEYYDRDVVEQAGLQPLKAVNGVIPIPKVPNPRQLLSGPWAHYTPVTFNWDFRGDYALTSSWTLMAEVGRSYSDRTRFSSRLTNYNLMTGDGKLTTTFLHDQDYINKFERTELLGNLDTWIFSHDLTIGAASTERDFNNPQVVSSTQPQSAYSPVATVAPIFSLVPQPTQPQLSRDVGLYAYDTVSFWDRWKLLLGFRETYYHADNQDNYGGGPHTIKDSRVSSPAYGLIYRFAPRSEIYISFMQGLEETGEAPIGTTNQYAILPPAVAKQKEVGLRSTFFKQLTGSAAYFDISRANATVDPTLNTFLLDGITIFRGVELTTAYAATQQLSFTLAGQYLDAKEHPIFDLALEGKQPQNTGKLSGNFNASYKLPWIFGLTLRAGTSYVGPRFVNDLDQGQIPGVLLFNAGLGYTRQIYGHPASFQMSVENLTDKSYWNSATVSQFGAGMDRSFRFNFRTSL